MYTGLHVLPQRGLVVMHANLWRYVCIQVCMYYHREVLWKCMQTCGDMYVYRFACITREVSECKTRIHTYLHSLHVLPQTSLNAKPVEIHMYTDLHALPERSLR